MPDITEQLVRLATAIETRNNLEQRWKEADRQERAIRETRQHRIILLLIFAVLLLAGVKVTELVGLGLVP
jgi:integrase